MILESFLSFIYTKIYFEQFNSQFYSDKLLIKKGVKSFPHKLVYSITLFYNLIWSKFNKNIFNKSNISNKPLRNIRFRNILKVVRKPSAATIRLHMSGVSHSRFFDSYLNEILT